MDEKKTIRFEDGREILPIFDVAAWMELDELLPDEPDSVSEMMKRMVTRKEYKWATMQMVSLTVNCAAVHAGEEPVMTPEMAAQKILPGDIVRARDACVQAVSRAFRVEHKEKTDKPVDVVLEEIEKKTESESAPAEKSAPGA